MKQYPRIYRLSTLGLRQHQEFDYEFHNFRTDFVGESGSGKSMIADLLQLILVGSEAFVSATEALGGKRTPDGMVLKTQDARGTEIGYAFLNVLVEQDQYVVIGAYIESSGKTTDAFVIQQGYDENLLIPLNEPLSFKHFLSDEKVSPLNELKTHLEIHGLVCKSWHHKKGYHKFLYKHNLLPLDLSISDKVLKDYAAIIQSFSRGKSLDTQKGSNLKSFLYGDEAAKRIHAKYQDTVADMQSSFNEHIRNRKEIDLVSRKQKKLSLLLTKEATMNRLKYEWLLNKAHYTYLREGQLFEEVRSFHQSTYVHYQSLNVIQRLMTTKLEGMEAELKEKQGRVETAKNNIDRLRGDHEKLKTVQTWLKRFQIDLDQLQDRYTRDKGLYEMKTSLLRVDRMLREVGVWEYFTAVPAKESKTAFIDFLENEKNSSLEHLQRMKGLLSFWDLDEKGSLGSWALSQQRAFSMEEESLIMHFKELLTRKPSVLKKGLNRYIAMPDTLLKNASFTEPDNDGSWLHIGGIREYIPWVKEQLFTRDNLPQIKHFVDRETANLKQEIEKLQKKIELIKKLRELIINEKNFDTYLRALSQRQEAMGFSETDLIKLSEDELESYIQVGENKDEIIDAFKTAEEVYNIAYEASLNIRTLNTDLQEEDKKTRSILDSNRWTGQLLEIHEELKQSLQVIGDTSNEFKYLNESYERSANRSRFIRDKIDQHKSNLNTFKLQVIWEEWKTAKEQKQQAWETFEAVYHRQPDKSLFEDNVTEGGNDKKIKYDAESNSFQNLFNEIVAELIPNESYRLKDYFDTVELGTALLPGAFREVSATSDNMIELISTYLERINDKNKELNRRKLQKIKDLLDDVGDEISERITIAKQIDQFLNQEDKEITGGHRVRLTVELSREYPKHWIEVFQHKLESDPNYGINDEVAEGISLEEKIISVFQSCITGNIGRPKIEKLLDPNAYLELVFSMKSSGGQLNKGSNGQSYAGIALLCIARLSVIGAIDSRKTQPGIRFMPIDEAEGLGSNYDMLYNIAKAHDYQIISLSINPLGKFKDGEQYMYMLHKNTKSEEAVNNTPIGIFCNADIKKLFNND